MIKLYIANLGKYVEGYHVGNWITLPVEQEDFDKFLLTIEVDGIRYEEIAIHDYETDLGISISEYESLKKLNYIAEITEGKETEFSAIYSVLGNLNDTVKTFESEDFLLFPEVNSEEDLGYMWVDEGLLGIKIPSELEDFIDYEALGRSLEFDITPYGAIQIY